MHTLSLKLSVAFVSLSVIAGTFARAQDPLAALPRAIEQLARQHEDLQERRSKAVRAFAESPANDAAAALLQLHRESQANQIALQRLWTYQKLQGNKPAGQKTL